MKSIAIEIKLNGIPTSVKNANELKKVLKDLKTSAGGIKLDPESAKAAEAAISALTKTQEKQAKASKTQETGYVSLSKEISRTKVLLEEMMRSGFGNASEIEKQKQKLVSLTLEQWKNRNETRQLIQEKQSEIKSYSGLSAKLNILRNSYKDLVVQEKQNTKEGRAMLKNIKTLDKELKGIDASVGQFQRNVGDYSGALSKFGKNIFAAFGIVGGSSFIIGAIADITKESIELANSAKGVEFAFSRIEGSAAILERSRASTQGLLSDLDIKKAIVDFDNFGIELDQLPELLEFVSVRAAQTGKSFDTMLDSLVEGLSKESKLRIDNLGISTKELNDELEKTPNFVQAVANIAKREIKQAGDVISEADKAQERFNATIENAKILYGNYVNQAIKPAVGQLGVLVETLKDAIFPQERLSGLIFDQQLNLNLLVSELASANTSEERRLQLINQIKESYPEFNRLIDVETASSEQLTGALKKINDEYINRIVLQKEVEKGQDIQAKADKAAESAGELRGKLFEQLNNAVAKNGLETTVSLNNIKESAADVLKELDKIKPKFGEVFTQGGLSETVDFFFGERDAIKTTIRNIEIFENVTKSLNDQLGEQASKTEEVKEQLGLKTEAEKEEIAIIERKNELAQQLFDLDFGQLNVDQLKIFNDHIKGTGKNSEASVRSLQSLREKLTDLRKEYEAAEIGSAEYLSLQKEITRVEKELATATGQVKSNIENIDPKSLQGIKRDISKINDEISRTSDYTKMEAALDRLKTKTAELEALEAQIAKINAGLGGASSALDKAVNNELEGSEFGFLTGEVAPKENVDNDPITAETITLEKLKALREKYGIDELLRKENLSKAEQEILKKYQEERKTLELQREVEIAAAKLGINFQSNEERLQAEQDYYDALEGLRQDDIAKEEAKAEKVKEILLKGVEYAMQVADLIFKVENERVERGKQLRIDALEDEYDTKIKLATGDADEQKRLTQELSDKREEIELQAAKKKQALAYKEALIGAALAIVKAIISGGGLPYALPAVAATVFGTGLQLAAISAQKFEQGGEIIGKSHAQGGELIEAEGGEFMLNKKAASNPIIKKIAKHANLFGEAPATIPKVQGYGSIGGYQRIDNEPVPAAVYNIAVAQVNKDSRMSEEIGEKVSIAMGEIMESKMTQIMKDAFSEVMEDIGPRLEKGVENGTYKGSSLGGEESFRRREREDLAREESQK